MRFFYLFLFFSLRITTPIYFRRRKTVNAPKGFFGRTIYVSNHAASFMDPLLIASFRRPIVFFMVRADIFTPFMKPIVWAAHMLPIYRQLDGDDTKGKNEAIFKTCSRILRFGRNLLIFGEGFTDDVFIRRLKPVKKGAIRIGFTALEEMNWKKKIYLAAVGCNYSDPNYMRSDILISTSDKICLNDYREAFEKNPNKVLTELTKLIEQKMRDQITHVENKEWAPFHEQVMQLTRKGMNAENHNASLPLENRWRYSQNLANWLNGQHLEESKELQEVRTELGTYFTLLKRFKIQEKYIYDFQSSTRGSRRKELLYLLTMWPFALLGLVHCLLPYLLIKRFTEKSFKRKVFWSSVKMMLGKAVMGIFNIPFIFVFHSLIYPNYWMAMAYYLFAIPILGLIAYLYHRKWREFKTKGVLQKMDLSKFMARRKMLLKKIETIIPVA
jgi:1-acyl-sn-glycerol-3-phosphate acyltransferase